MVSSPRESDDFGAALIGRVIADRYQVEDHLGEGGMGVVYRARHVALGKEVALKVLHPEFARKPELVERFLREARAASRIRNEHVIDITDFGVTLSVMSFSRWSSLRGATCTTFSSS